MTYEMYRPAVTRGYVKELKQSHAIEIASLMGQIRLDKKRIVELKLDLGNVRRELNERKRTATTISPHHDNMRR